MLRRLTTGWKALIQLGFEQVSLFTAYKLGLVTGVWRRLTPAGQDPSPIRTYEKNFVLKDNFAGRYREFIRIYPDQSQEIIREADEICAGLVRLFGGPPVPLRLTPVPPLHHWTTYERGRASFEGDEDAKLTWEPGRFGWAFTLARAYLLTESAGYAQEFWRRLEEFLRSNPANLGPHWMSAQEVALRLMALAFANDVFTPISTPDRTALLEHAIAEHAARIPATLLYARSQNNNHLLTEAAGLYTAGVLLRGNPQAERWLNLGWKWFNQGICKQVEMDGVYSQHSSNYHRLMLQTALWMNTIARQAGGRYWPQQTRERLAAATRWLLDQLDPLSGRVPNLGSNDGALILPLAPGGFADFRPVAQAAALAFLGERALPEGPWDELAMWLGIDEGRTTHDGGEFVIRDPEEAHPELRMDESRSPHPLATFILHPSPSSWASLRAVHFTGRPAHADQLHVEIWHRGENIALDAGSFRYTASPPWDNSLARTLAHNTITVNGQDQMTRAGKFLWLDWAQARRLRQDERVLEAEHDGYRGLGIIHRRKLERLGEDRWRVRDTLLPSGQPIRAHSICLHWLLPDWLWSLQGNVLVLRGPEFLVQVRVTMSGAESSPIQFDLVRAGESLVRRDPQVAPILGWRSPTYNLKLPAISFRAEIRSDRPLALPVSFQSDFSFPG